jgi:hypothetical protein
MVIFHSYVKLPEGKIHETKILAAWFHSQKETTTEKVPHRP